MEDQSNTSLPQPEPSSAPQPPEPQNQFSAPQPAEMQHPATPVLEQKRCKNKKLIVFIAVLVAVIAAAAIYFLVFKKDKAEAPAATNNEPQQSVETVTQAKKANEVYYFYKASDKEPYVLYKRPVAGGDRVEIMKLGDSEYPGILATSDNAYLFAVNSQLWLGRYDGKTPNKIADFNEGTYLSLVGAVFKDDGGFYVSVSSDSEQPEEEVLYSFNSNGENKQAVFTHDGRSNAMYIRGFGDNKIALLESCIDCDGSMSLNTTKTFNLKDKSYTDSSPFDIFGEVEPEYRGYRLGIDFRTMYYFKPTVDKAIKIQSELGYPYDYYVGAPYTLTKTDTTTKTETPLLGNLGKKEVKTQQGYNYTAYHIQGFFNQGNETANYFDNKAQLIKDNDLVSLHEFAAGENIIFPVYATTDVMIVGAAKYDPSNTTDIDVPVYYIDIAKKTVTEIMKAPNQYTIFAGVSLK